MSCSNLVSYLRQILDILLLTLLSLNFNSVFICYSILSFSSISFAILNHFLRHFLGLYNSFQTLCLLLFLWLIFELVVCGFLSNLLVILAHDKAIVYLLQPLLCLFETDKLGGFWKWKTVLQIESRYALVLSLLLHCQFVLSGW